VILVNHRPWDQSPRIPDVNLVFQEEDAASHRVALAEPGTGVDRTLRPWVTRLALQAIGRQGARR
jgi:hypothetical protein